jgi:hypothetical protein
MRCLSPTGSMRWQDKSVRFGGLASSPPETHPSTDNATLSLDFDGDYPETREGVRRVCADFSGSYWRRLEEAKAYPTAFVNALSVAHTLGVQISDAYRGNCMPLRAAAVNLEEVHAYGCNARTCHAKMYTCVATRPTSGPGPSGATTVKLSTARRSEHRPPCIRV